MCTQAAAMSSTYKNSRLGVPEPQMLTLDASLTLASWKRRMSAGITWEFSG